MRTETLRLWRETEDGLWAGNISGYDMPTGTIVVEKSDILVLKVPGYSYWFQHPPGPTHSYAPAEYKVFRIREFVEKQPFTWMPKVEVLVEFPVRTPSVKE